jgi:hypothetical protein
VRPTLDKIPLDKRLDELIQVRTCGSISGGRADHGQKGFWRLPPINQVLDKGCRVSHTTKLNRGQVCILLSSVVVAFTVAQEIFWLYISCVMHTLPSGLTPQFLTSSLAVIASPISGLGGFKKRELEGQTVRWIIPLNHKPGLLLGRTL